MPNISNFANVNVTTLRVGTTLAYADGMFGISVDEMARLLRERTNGRLDVKTYSGGQLGSERDTLEITVFGGLDMKQAEVFVVDPDPLGGQGQQAINR